VIRLGEFIWEALGCAKVPAMVLLEEESIYSIILTTLLFEVQVLHPVLQKKGNS
jgi:hypothetical protein